MIAVYLSRTLLLVMFRFGTTPSDTDRLTVDGRPRGLGFRYGRIGAACLSEDDEPVDTVDIFDLPRSSAYAGCSEFRVFDDAVEI